MTLAERWSGLRALGPQQLAIPLGLFLAGFFLLPSSKLLNHLCYALVLAPALFLLHGADWRWLVGSSLWRAVTLLLSLLVVSGLWSAVFRLEDWLHEVRALPRLLIYLAVVATVCVRRPALWERLLRTTTLAAAVGTIVSAVSLYTHAPWQARLEYAGAAYNAIETAALLGSALMLVLFHILPASSRWRGRAVWAVCALVLIVGIVLTGSRTPIAAALACLGLGLALYRRWCLLAALIGCLLLLGLLTSGSDIIRQGLARSDSYRIAIWQQYAARVATTPWRGEGLLADEATSIVLPGTGGASLTIQHPHNVYLATALYGGLPALALLLGVIVLGLRQAWLLAARGEAVWLLALLFSLLCMLTHGNRLLDAPRSISWFYFWLPVGVLIGRQAAARNALPVCTAPEQKRADAASGRFPQPLADGGRAAIEAVPANRLADRRALAQNGRRHTCQRQD